MQNGPPPKALSRHPSDLSAQANQGKSQLARQPSLTLVTDSIGTARADFRVRARRRGIPREVAEQRPKKGHPMPAMTGPRRTRRLLARARPGKSIHHPGNCCTGCSASWHSAPHTRAACLLAQTSSFWVPTGGLGLMLATTEIACILVCGFLGWGLGLRPSCRCSQHIADD